MRMVQEERRREKKQMSKAPEVVERMMKEGSAVTVTIESKEESK